MNKGYVKKFTLLISLMLLVTVALSGCGGQKEAADNNGTDAKSEGYKIAYLNWGQGVPILDSFQAQAQYVNDVYGNKMQAVSDKFTADQQKTNVQNMIAAGVDGIMFDGVPTTMIPDLAAMCESAKMPFAIYDHTPSEATHEELTANKYYVGSVYLEGIKTGASIAERALKEGNKTAIIIGGAVGDSTHDQRVEGFKKAFEAGGGKVLGVTRCTDPSEAATKGEDLISANPKADCLYSLTGDFVPGPLNALGNLGITTMKVYSSCIDEATLTSIENGEVAAGNDGSALPAAIAAMLMQNYLDGNQIVDDAGKAPYITTNSFMVDKNNAADYRAVFIDDNPFTEDQVKNLSSKYNDKVDLKAFTDFINGLSLDTIVEAHK